MTMTSLWRILTGSMLITVATVTCAVAQTRDVTVPYLRAAIGALPDRSRVTVKAKYDAASGLREATGRYLRSKGFSRFSIIDPETGVSFDSVYCEQDSKAFNQLLAVSEDGVFVFSGYRGRGEMKEDALFVTDVRAVLTPRQSGPEQSDVPEDTYRVIVTDLVSSNRTVLTNVEPGKSYRFFGTEIVLEREPRPGPNDVRVIGE
jgi:hypothetical protein